MLTDKVGTVTSIEYDYENAGNVLVKCDIDPQLRIPKGSQAEIESDLMGNIKVNLLLANNPKEKIEPGGLIMGIDDITHKNCSFTRSQLLYYI